MRRPIKALFHAWFLRLPPGLRDRPAWVFIGFLVGWVGVSYAFAFSQSVISQAIGPIGLRFWGVVLMLSGFGVCYATIRANHALERLTLRIMSTCILTYCGWLFTLVDLRRLAMTIVFATGLVLAVEIRIATLKALFSTAERRDES